MATVQERFEGRTEIFDSLTPRAEIPYVVFNATDEADAKTALTAAIATAYNGIPLDGIELVERINATTWTAIAYYQDNTSASAAQVGSKTSGFDTSGGTQHITQSLETVSMYGPKASNQLGGAIGFDGENVNGVDITVPIFNLSENHVLQEAAVTTAYQTKLMELTGKVNLYPFRGFAAGEVLFLGATGSQRDDKDWDITFRFAALKNQSNLTIGTIGGISKKGWEYLWVQYEDQTDDATDQVVKAPSAVYVEKVYEQTSFGPLGIGR